MRKTILTITLMTLVLSTFAQLPFALGIKGSINSSKITTDDYQVSNLTYANFKSDAKSGYALGVFARLGTSIYLQPELLYCVKKSQSTSGSMNQNIDLKTIQVPILLGFKLIDLKLASIRAFTGPAMSYVLNGSKITYDNVTGTGGLYDTKNYKNNIWDWQLGAGVDVGPLVVDVRYEWGLSNTSGGNVNEVGFVNKGNTLTFSLGFKFL
ncbi:MAG TPA: porin family protein [Paludibacter sp.]